MSKTKTLFTVALLILFGSIGAAQAQLARYEFVAVPEPFAREGGLAEKSGPVYIITTALDDEAMTLFGSATVTLDYSVPLSTAVLAGGMVDVNGDLMPVVSDAAGKMVEVFHKSNSNSQNGRIVIDGTGNGSSLSIVGVLLDVSDTAGPVTVKVSVVRAENALEGSLVPQTATTATVINTIKLGVDVAVKSNTIRTRGTGSGSVAATLQFKPGFGGAFNLGDQLELEVEGLPDGVVIDIKSAHTKKGEVVTPDAEDASAPTAGLSTELLRGDAGEDLTVTITLGDDATTATNAMVGTEFTLTLALTANPGATAVRGVAFPTFPLGIGDINARLTFTGPNFDDAFTPSTAIFKIRPAQCTLLFPLVARIPSMAWNTGISVMNPGYKGGGVAGGLTFTFYGNDGTVADFSTAEFPNVGEGLDELGEVPKGGTYSILASEILAATNWGEEFLGHVHVLADYTDCNGVGWVTDFTTVNQAYVAVVLDRDTGK